MYDLKIGTKLIYPYTKNNFGYIVDMDKHNIGVQWTLYDYIKYPKADLIYVIKQHGWIISNKNLEFISQLSEFQNSGEQP